MEIPLSTDLCCVQGYHPHPSELFQPHPGLYGGGVPGYSVAGVKDEPRVEAASYPYYGYPDLVNPYVHMGRKEKRKKHDSLPGGQTLTRDERKVGTMQNVDYI